MMMNPAYKHLTDRLRIGELTVPQIVGLFGGFMCGIVFALYISPFGAYPTLFLSIYIAGIPAGTVLLATSTEFDLWLYVKACTEEVLTDGRYTAGAGETAAGYEIEPDEPTDQLSSGGARTLELEELWAL
jgi:hypothetical protein